MAAGLIKGITITLYTKTANGTDAFNRSLYTETAVQIPNVLVQPISGSEVVEILNLTGRRALYRLGIPKGDNHDWTDAKVSFFGKTFKTIGTAVEGIESLIPLDWNKKIEVEAFG